MGCSRILDTSILTSLPESFKFKIRLETMKSRNDNLYQIMHGLKRSLQNQVPELHNPAIPSGKFITGFRQFLSLKSTNPGLIPCTPKLHNAGDSFAENGKTC